MFTFTTVMRSQVRHHLAAILVYFTLSAPHPPPPPPLSLPRRFDTIIVATSLAAIPFNDVPGLNELRLARVLRVLERFKPFEK